MIRRIGVVADAKNRGIQDPPFPEVVVPSSITKTPARALVVKTARSPLAMLGSVKREIWAVDRGVSVGSSRPLTAYLAQFTYAEPRLGQRHRFTKLDAVRPPAGPAQQPDGAQRLVHAGKGTG